DGVVDEDVLPLVRSDETETLLIVEPLDLTGGHESHSFPRRGRKQSWIAREPSRSSRWRVTGTCDPGTFPRVCGTAAHTTLRHKALPERISPPGATGGDMQRSASLTEPPRAGQRMSCFATRPRAGASNVGGRHLSTSSGGQVVAHIDRA